MRNKDEWGNVVTEAPSILQDKPARCKTIKFTLSCQGEAKH